MVQTPGLKEIESLKFIQASSSDVENSSLYEDSSSNELRHKDSSGVSKRMRLPVFNALDYGGFTHASIQAAINAANTAGGGIVFIPNGTYVLSADITIPQGAENIQIIGESHDAVLSGGGTYRISVATPTSKGTYDLTAVVNIGDRIINTADSSGAAIGDVWSFNHGGVFEITDIPSGTQIELKDSIKQYHYANWDINTVYTGSDFPNNIIIKNLFLDNSGIALYYTKNSRIENCVGINNSYAAIAYAFNGIISKCNMTRDTTAVSLSRANYCIIEDSCAIVTGSGIIDAMGMVECHDCIMRNCKVYGDYTGADKGIELYLSSGCLVEGNQIYWKGAYGISEDSSSAPLTNCNHNRIINNSIMGGPTHGIYVRDIDRAVISGNVIGQAVTNAIYYVNLTESIITGNSSPQAITAGGVNTGTVIANNT